MQFVAVKLLSSEPSFILRSSSKPSIWVQEEDEASTVTDQESDWIDDEHFSDESKSDDGEWDVV